MNCRSEKRVYVLYRVGDGDAKEPIGWYDSLPEVVCAFESEREKEDGVRLEIRTEAAR